MESPVKPADIEKQSLVLGFIPLSDCAPLVIALEKGFFARHGLHVHLSKETSWSNIRDKLAFGILDGAQTLATLPITSTLGIGPILKPTVTALSLDLNGNAITVSESLYQEMLRGDTNAMQETPITARALKVVVENRQAGQRKLRFAVVFPTSTHAYELRYWMASAGINPELDIEIVVIPPPQMVNALRRGEIDGYCVGEPWSQQAVKEGLGRVLVSKYEIWNNSPEKVFAVNEEWAEQNPVTHQAVLLALIEACRWVDMPENRHEVSSILAKPKYVNAPEEVIRMSMLGTFQYAQKEFPRSMPDFNVFHRYSANFPWRSHALWLLSQMIRWGHVSECSNIHELAARVYRPDVYRQVANAIGIHSPQEDYKMEGIHQSTWQLDGLLMGADRFFDGKVFSPRDIPGYLGQFEVNAIRMNAEQLRKCCRPGAAEENYTLGTDAAHRSPGV